MKPSIVDGLFFGGMMNYYQEVLEQIQREIDNHNYDEANFLLTKELRMPYIPIEIENKLKQLKKECIASNEKEVKELKTEDILALLQKNDACQLRAANLLLERNLHEYVNEIKEYLSFKPNEEAAALLIEGLAKQKVREEFILHKNGLEYVFWPEEVIPVVESKGFWQAKKYLHLWLENKHPDFLALCESLLVHECYVFLPLSYDENEAKELALVILKKVSNYMDDGDIYKKILKNNYIT